MTCREVRMVKFVKHIMKELRHANNDERSLKTFHKNELPPIRDAILVISKTCMRNPKIIIVTSFQLLCFLALPDFNTEINENPNDTNEIPVTITDGRNRTFSIFFFAWDLSDFNCAEKIMPNLLMLTS